MTDDIFHNEDWDEGRWRCNQKDCGMAVECNPTLYLGLNADGSWFIEGVADEAAYVVCTEGHHQNDLILEKSMSAFLEEKFPNGTWQGSAPDRD